MIGNADFGDTAMESPLKRGMTASEIRAYRKSLAEDPRIEKLATAVQKYRTALKEIGQTMKTANKEQITALKGQIRELRVIRASLK